MWKVYIVRCSDDTLYTGITTDTERRLYEHNTPTGKGAKYTRMRQPVELVYVKEMKSKSDAAKEEYRIKQLSREDKLKLID